MTLNGELQGQFFFRFIAIRYTNISRVLLVATVKCSKHTVLNIESTYCGFISYYFNNTVEADFKLKLKCQHSANHSGIIN